MFYLVLRFGFVYTHSGNTEAKICISLGTVHILVVKNVLNSDDNLVRLHGRAFGRNSFNGNGSITPTSSHARYLEAR